VKTLTRYLNTLALSASFVTTTSFGAANFAYSYDSLHRVTNVISSDGSRETYSYDAAGNRLSRITGVFDLSAPSVPAGLVVATNNSGNLQLSWNPSQDVGSGVAGYRVYLNGETLANTTFTTLTLTNLFPNTAYCVTVAAYDLVHNISTLSSQLCLVTPEQNLSGNSLVSIAIYPISCPIGNRSPNWDAFLVNAMHFLKTGQGLTFDRSSPTDFIISDRYEAGDIMASRTNTPLWLGQFNPSAPFNSEMGNTFRFAAKIVSIVPFNLAGVTYVLQSSDPANALGRNGVGEQMNYNLAWSGLWYGADGIKSTADDVWRTSGASTNLVNEIYYIGEGKYFNCDSPSDVNAITNYLSSNAPLTLKCTYNIFNPGGRLMASAFRVISPSSGIPARQISISAPSNGLDFGSVAVGNATNLSFVISNSGDTSVTISGIGCPYGFSSGWVGGLLPPGGQTNVSIRFQPEDHISYGGVLTIYSDAFAGVDTVPVSGMAIGNSASNVNITVYASPGPNSISSSFIPFRKSVIQYLETGVGLALNRSFATNALSVNAAEFGDVVVSTNPVSLWRGVLNPDPPFGGERGGFVYFPVRIISAVPFNLTGVSWEHRDTSPLNILSYVGAMTNFVYSASLVGYWYGSDGVKGTLDDRRISSGAATQAVNELYLCGVASSFKGSSQVAVSNALSYVINNSPFAIICTWKVTDPNGTLLAASSKSIPIFISLPPSPPLLSVAGYSIQNQFSMLVTGDAGASYELWISTNLTHWQFLQNFTAKYPVSQIYDLATNAFDARFYRLTVRTNW
jgi:YD repeat-containing protein